MDLHESNAYQIYLIRESGLPAVDWIETYSQKFRDLVEGGITNFDELKFSLYSM